MINLQNIVLRRNSRLVIIGVIVALILWWLWGAIFGSGYSGLVDLPPVTIATAEIHDMPIYAHAIGSVIANATVQVKSRVDGQIISIGFHEGQLVHAGDLLFQLDPKPSEAALRGAQAARARDEAQLVDARLDLNRANLLAKKGYTSQQARDLAAAQVKALTGTVAADRAAVDQAQLQLDYTQIRSPLDGKTGPLLVDAGNLVKANDTNALVVITQLQPVKISFALAQQNLPKLQARMRDNSLVASLNVHAVFDAAQNEGTTPAVTPEGDAATITAPVNFINNQVDVASGTIELRATYDNPQFRLVPGEFVDVTVRLDDLKQTITVPREAVNTGQNGRYVFVVKADNKVEMRDVEVLNEDGPLIALTGIKAGERIVTDGQLRIINGAAVKIMENGPPTT